MDDALSEPDSPVRPAAPAVGDLQVFMLETAVIKPVNNAAAPPPEPAKEKTAAPMSIRGAWNSFINPDPPVRVVSPPKKRQSADRATVPASATADAAISIPFRHPADAVPPPRLAAFALPSSVHPDLYDRPSDVCFCLTLANGHRVHGSALQLAEQLDDDADGGSRVVLRALVLLSTWPVHELWRTMLHTLYTRGEALGPGACLTPTRKRDSGEASSSSSSAPLTDLLLRTSDILSQSNQELQWLTTHPLYLPTPLAPLFKALNWKAASATYLLASLLTDQKVLLHSDEPHRLYCATTALKSLMTPLTSSAVFIPLLPSTLMSLEEVHVLLCDCSTPYLIGVESSLVASFRGHLPEHAVIVDLDRGTVRRPPNSDEWFNPRAPIYESLSAELQRCMGQGSAFKALRAQAACLRFIVDVLNIRKGFLSRSIHEADADALSRFELLESFAADAASRCKQQQREAGYNGFNGGSNGGGGVAEEAVEVMRAALHQSVGASLSEVCRDANDRFNSQMSGGRPSDAAPVAASASPATSSSGGAIQRAAAARALGGGASAASSALDVLLGSEGPYEVDAGGGPCCGALCHIYASSPFREWWGLPSSRTRAAERLQWLDYRSKGVDLIEYVRENHRSMKVLERSLEARLHAIWAEDPGNTPSPPEEEKAETVSPEPMRPPTDGKEEEKAEGEQKSTPGHRRSNSVPTKPSPEMAQVSSTRSPSVVE